ncbi:MAG: cadherin repeat domain-containing protein [Myxococcota bacterium]
MKRLVPSLVVGAWLLACGSSSSSAPDDPAPTDAGTLRVEEVENQPPVASGGPFTVLENSAVGTVVGTITVQDPDEGQTHFFTFAEGNRGQAFAIDAATGVITVAHSNPLDFEGWPYFTVVVRVTDSGSPARTALLSVNLTVTNANDPPSVVGGPFEVREGSVVGTLVGSVSARDQDEGQSHAFTITGGNTGNAFSMDRQGTIRVANRNALDFESAAEMVLEITVADNGSPSLSATREVTIRITDANEPPVAQESTFSVVEHSAAGTVVGTISVTDPDAGQEHTFVIVAGNTGGAFAVDDEGVLTVAEPSALDRQAQASFALTLHVFDNGDPQLAAEANVVVELTAAQ